MKFLVFLFSIFFFLNSNLAHAQNSISYISEQEKNLISSWEASTFKNHPSYLQFSYVTDEPSVVEEFYLKHKSELSKKIRDRDSNKKKAETIFKYLHENVFIQYELNSRVKDLANSNKYNCVTATSFFVSMAEEFGIPFQVYETPAHVYASISHRNEEVIIELTAPKDGFDFGSNMESLLQTLVDSKLISRDELAEKGPEQLYQDYIARTIPISKKQLLAVQYHNEALIEAENDSYVAAYNQMNKAIFLYPNETFSEAYKYIITISQLDFTIDESMKYTLLNSALNSTKSDSTLSYTFVNYLGELIEDLLKFEENFNEVEQLLEDTEVNIFSDPFLEQKMREFRVYTFISFAQNASLKGETIKAKSQIEKALELSPENSRLITYYISVTSSHALKLSQSGLFQTARSIIDNLDQNYPEGYPIIKETKVQIILDALVPIPFVIENQDRLLPELELARSIQPENIYLKSFSVNVYHELAMQQVRRSNYEQAKKLILDGLSYNNQDPTLKSDLELINEILK